MRHVICSPPSPLVFFPPHLSSSIHFWWSQLSFCQQYGGISRFWWPLHTSWVWVCLRSVWAGCSRARCLGSGQTGAKLRSPSSCSPISLRLSVSRRTTRQITWQKGSDFRRHWHDCMFVCYVKVCSSYLGFVRNYSLTYLLFTPYHNVSQWRGL